MSLENKISTDSKLTEQQDGTVVVENSVRRSITKEQAIAEITTSIQDIRNSRANLQAQIDNCDAVEADLQQKLASLLGA